MLLRGCDSPKSSKNDVKLDKVTHDTIVKITPAPYKVTEFKVKYYPKWDTVRLIDSNEWNKDLCKFERQYTDSLPDSNVTIFTNIRTIGILKSSQIKYRLKVPLRIETIIKTDSIYTKPNKTNFIVFGGIGGIPGRFDITAGLAITHKRAYYGYEYSPIYNTHSAKIGFILFKSRN